MAREGPWPRGGGEILPGATVFSTLHLKVKADDGSHTVAVRWGDAGTVVEQREGSRWLVSFPQRHRGLAPGQLVVDGSALVHEKPCLLQGQWVTFTRDIEFSAAGMVQKGSPALVQDVRRGPSNACSVLVRAAEVTRRTAFDFAVAFDEVEPLQHMPEDLQIATGELSGGYRVADACFSMGDIKVLGDGDVAVTAVAIGHVGLVFGPALTQEARDQGELLVRFEARQDSLRPVWLNVHPSNISKTRPLLRGHSVAITTSVRFPDGTMAQKGERGVLLEKEEGGAGRNLVRVGGSIFVPPADGFAAPATLLPCAVEERALFLEELETIAKEYEAAGRALQNVSLLEQNMWGIFGHGFGINVSFLTHHSIGRIGVVADDGRTTLLKYHTTQGLDGTLENESKMGFNHNALINDKGRNRAYAAAIQRCAPGRRALDIGTGPVALLARLCLKGGAASVEAVENTESSLATAIDGLRTEAAGGRPELVPVATGYRTEVPDWARLAITSAEALKEEGLGQRAVARIAPAGDEEAREIRLYRGLSSDTSLGLTGGYSMLVHEILGDMAGTEGAAAVIADIRDRGLVTPDCLFVPRSSSTLIAPTSTLSLDTLSSLLHRWGHAGHSYVRPLERISARYFPKAHLLAEAQPLELLDFQNGPELLQERTLEFSTSVAGPFDGMHMHLHVDLDGEEYIDVLEQHNTSDRTISSNWSTLYVRLLEEPMQLPAGSRIICRCRADLRESLARYSIAVSVGEQGNTKDVAEFEWAGG